MKSIKYYIFMLLAWILLFSCSPAQPENKIARFYNYPNPFNSREGGTTYSLSLNSGSIKEATVSIYSDTVLVAEFNLTTDTADATKWGGVWSGLDRDGKYLPAGVYLANVRVRDEKEVIYISSTKTDLR